MPRIAAREAAAYGSVLAGVCFACVLILWKPVVPVSVSGSVRPHSAFLSSPLPSPIRLTAPPERTAPPAGYETFRTPPLDKEPLPRLSREPAPRPVAPRRSAGSSPPVPAGSSPIKVETKSINSEIPIAVDTPAGPHLIPHAPLSVVAPSSNIPQSGIRVRIVNPLEFREKLLGIATRESASISFFDGPITSVRIVISPDRKPVLKSELGRAVFDHLADEGAEYLIEVVNSAPSP